MADRALVERARGGDSAAYEALARAASRRLFLIAQRILRDTDAAEDAVQQTLVTVWRELPRLRDPGNFDAWTYRIVTRAAIAEAKRQKRRKLLIELKASEPAMPGPTAQVEARDAIDHAFQRLSPENRAVVVLRFYADLTIRDIGEVMGIPAGTVASRLHRAMHDLRIAIDGETKGLGDAAHGDEQILVRGATR